jgi:uncharacterized protein
MRQSFEVSHPQSKEFPMRRLSAVLMMTTVALAALPLAALAETTATISVSGEGRVATSPDMATITLGVTTFAKTAALALSANSADVAKVVANLTEAGIEAKDIQTNGLMLNPNVSYTASGSVGEIDGYTAMNMVTIRVRKLDTLGTVLDAAVKDGANTLNGLMFGLADQVPVLDQARLLAVTDARRKAELLATAAGASLGRVIAISESTGYPENAPMFRAEASFDGAGAVPVAGGEIGMTITVSMTWEIAE